MSGLRKKVLAKYVLTLEYRLGAYIHDGHDRLYIDSGTCALCVFSSAMQRVLPGYWKMCKHCPITKVRDSVHPRKEVCNPEYRIFKETGNVVPMLKLLFQTYRNCLSERNEV